MTIPVTSLTNLYGSTTINTAAGTSGESSRNFNQVMGNITNDNHKSDTYQQNKSIYKEDHTTKLNDSADTKINDGKVLKNEQNKSTTLDKKVDVTDEKNLDEDALAMVNEKAEELITAIADKLNVSEDDVLNAMEVLGMTNVDLLNPDMPSQLVVNISGEDMMSLVMDEALYENLNDLLQTVDTIKADLAETLGISEEELPGVLDQMTNMTKNSQQTEEIETMTTAKDTMNQEQSKTVVAEIEGNTPTQSETQLEKTSVNANAEETPELEETIEKPLESTMQQTGAQSKNTQQGYQENGHSFLQSLTETAANIAENVNTNATDTSFTNALNAQDTESIMRQMVDYMKLHVNANVSEMEIQLQPASLGTVNLNIASKNGAITAQFTAQSETVKEALESQIVQLRENLDERGIKVEAIEVTVSSHEFERNLEQGEQETRDSEQAEATKKAGRRRIVLNQGESEDSEELDIDGLDEADRIQVELMQQRGNTMSLMA